MAVVIPNIAKGRAAHLATLPAATDAIVWVILQSAGLESDAVLRDYDTLAQILAGTTDEATFGGYARLTATAVTVTVDKVNDRVDIDAADPQWSPTTAQATGKIVACYDPDTVTGTDADLIPLFIDDFALTTPTSGTVTYQVAAGGFYRAT